MNAEQLTINYEARPVRRPRQLFSISELRRSEMFRQQRDGRPVYNPRKDRARLLEIFADGEWHKWLDLCHIFDTGAYGLDHLIKHLERREIIEAKPDYYGADPLAPDMPPKPYRGFQFKYRLRKK